MTSFRSIALVTLLVRDVFGYLFTGIGFWAFMLWLGNLPFSGGAVAPSDFQIAGLALVLGYPTGRLLYYVGMGLRYIVPTLGWDRLMPAVFEEFAKTGAETASLTPFDIPFTAENASLLCGRLLPRKIFISNPPLYFLYIARANTLRILNETMLGFAALGAC